MLKYHKELEASEPEICEHCGGNCVLFEGTEMQQECPTCHGTGEKDGEGKIATMNDEMNIFCPDCGSHAPEHYWWCIRWGERQNCQHLRVTVKWKLYARETRYEPAEYIGKAFCDDCGEEMEPEDVPEEAERKDVNI